MYGKFGAIQKKVVKYFEKHYVATRREIIESMPEHPENSIYRTIRRFMNEGVIIDAKQKMLTPPNRPKSQIAKNLKINTNNPRYIEYKKGDSTL